MGEQEFGLLAVVLVTTFRKPGKRPFGFQAVLQPRKKPKKVKPKK